MSKALIKSVNNTTQTVTSGNAINFGTPARRYGCALRMDNGNLATFAQGYYVINANISFTATAGTATFQFYKNGAPVEDKVVRTVVADTTFDLNIPTVIREYCDCESVITLVVTGVTATVTNASIIAIKE